MKVREYLDKATAYVADPAKALEVRRELQAHLEEAVSEAAGAGLDPESAELLAVGKMGPPEAVAVQLAAAHHTHLPWRIYLSPLPLLLLLIPDGVADKFPWLGLFAWGLLVWCLVPDLTTLKRWLRVLYIDVVAKRDWLGRQPLRAALISGGAGGLVAGFTFSLIPAISRLVYLSGLYGLWVPQSLWRILAQVGWLAGLAPVVPGVLVTAAARRFFKGDPLMTAVFAALAFALSSLPSLIWFAPGLAGWAFFSLAVALVALALGWTAQRMQRQGTMPSDR